jgi:GNAT superfamily N-acetyltransferase
VSARAAALVEECGPDDAGTVHRLTQAAFAEQASLDPPSGAGRESPDSVRADLAAGGGAIAWLDGSPVGCLRFQGVGGHLVVRRVAVPPDLRGRGIGRSLMAWAEAEAARRGAAEVAVHVRLALPGNLAFYRRLGYAVVAEHAHAGYDRPTSAELRKRLAGPEGR